MKKAFAATFALLAVLVLATCSMAAPTGYIKINGQTYDASEDIAAIAAPNSELYSSGDTIEVYGQVQVPVTYGSTADARLPQYTWVVAKDNVTIEGKTDDAAIYCADDVNANNLGGMWGLQSTMIVLGNNVTLKNVAVMPNYNSYNAEDGYANKTVEVMGSGFTMDGGTITKNELATGGQTGNGGALFFNGSAAQDITVTNSTFNNTYVVFCDTNPSVNIYVTHNTFNTPLEDTYFIGNNTWQTPPNTEMGTVYVEDNAFTGLPAGYNKVVYQRMTGTFIVKDNVLTDVSGASVSMLDSISFGILNGTAGGHDYVAGGKGVILVTEAGKTYKVTTSSATATDLNVLEVNGATSTETPVTPAVGSTDMIEPHAPALLSTEQVLTSDDVAAVQQAAATATGMDAGSFELNAGGQVTLTQAAVAQAAAAVLEDNETVTASNVVPMPVFTTTVDEVGHVAAVGFELKGSDLMAANAADVKVLKVLSATEAVFFSHAASEAAYADGAFTVLDENDAIATTIDADATYTLVLFIQDNGSYDLNNAYNEITDPFAIVETSAVEGHDGGSSSSGCNAGFAAMALLLIAPLAALKKRS